MESGTPGGEGTPAEDVGSGEDEIAPSDGGEGTPAEAPAGDDDNGSGGEPPVEDEAPASGDGAAEEGDGNGPPEPGEPVE